MGGRGSQHIGSVSALAMIFTRDLQLQDSAIRCRHLQCLAGHHTGWNGDQHRLRDNRADNIGLHRRRPRGGLRRAVRCCESQLGGCRAERLAALAGTEPPKTGADLGVHSATGAALPRWGARQIVMVACRWQVGTEPPRACNEASGAKRKLSGKGAIPT